jgi:DNA-binding NarL/FixJ family response regulator
MSPRRQEQCLSSDLRRLLSSATMCRSFDTRKLDVLIVEDESLVREGIARLLASHASLNVLPPCSNAKAAIKAIAATQVDVVLLDFNLGGGKSVPVVTQAKELGFAGKILIVTAGLHDTEALELVSIGIAGIFLKTGSPELLVKAISRVAAGELWFDQYYIRLIVEHYGKLQSTDRTETISPREIGILRGVLEGLTNKEIAAKLAMSEGTVKASLQQLFNKAGVNSRSQLVRVTMEKYRDVI